MDRTYKRTYKAEFCAKKWTYVDFSLHDSTLVCIIIMDCCRMDSASGVRWMRRKFYGTGVFHTKRTNTHRQCIHSSRFHAGASADLSAPRQVIRVGFFEFEGYHMMGEDGTRSGYGYDFLRMMARYLNVEYEYLGYDCGWDEIQQMVRSIC